MMGRASRQIKVSLLLSAISKKENIQATDEDLRQEITRIAAETRRNPKDVLEDLQKRGLITGLVRQVTELKTLDWIVQKATA
jgi:trigger factor